MIKVLRAFYLFFLILGAAFGGTVPPFFESAGPDYIGKGWTGILQIGGDKVTLSPGNSKKPFVMNWIGSGRSRLEGAEPTGGVTNYLVGSDREKWRMGVPHFASVRANQVYPGIDIIYYFRDREFEFDIVAQPGANVHVIELEFDGKQDLRLGPNGDLLFTTVNGPMRVRRPDAYQVRRGKRDRVDCNYSLNGSGRITLILGDYETSLPLVVDPVIETMTYLGGGGIDRIQAVTIDQAGNPIVAGITTSDNFPGITHPAGDVSLFVTKLNAAGTTVIYTTVLGSRAPTTPFVTLEAVYSLAADTNGNAFITGTSLSSDFPTTAQAWSRQSSRGFVTELDASGAPVYSTFFPPAWGISPQRIRVNNGIAYVAGQVSAPEFLGTQGAYQRNVAGGTDLFVVALKPDGSGPLSLTAFGGSGNESLTDMAIDRAGNIALVGSSSSTNLPITDGAGFGTAAGTNFPILVRFDSSLSRLLYSAPFGSSFLSSVEAAPDGDLLIAGNGPVPDKLAALAAHYANLFPVDSVRGYIAKWSTSKNQPLWSSDLQSSPSFISTDLEGNIFWSAAPVWISGGAISSSTNAGIQKLSAGGDLLLYSSGIPATSSRTIASPDGSAWVAGWTSVSTLPTTTGVIQPNRDPTPFGPFNNPVNPDDGILAHLDLSTFRSSNFFVPPQTLGITWRLDQPAPPTAVLPLKTFSAGVSVEATPDSSLLSSTVTTDSIAVNVNTQQATTAGTFNSAVVIRSPPLVNSSLTVPVVVTIRPRINFQVAQTQVNITFREGQQVSPVSVPITTDFGSEFFGFNTTTSDRTWLFASVSTLNGTQLSISVATLPAGTYDATITISLTGDQVSGTQRVVSVHYVVTPPAVYHVSSNAVFLHVVKMKPLTPATITVTSEPSGVPLSLFLGISRTWLKVTQTSQTTPAQIQVSADLATAETGIYTFNLSINTEAGASAAAISITVDVASGASLDSTPPAIDYLWTRGGSLPNFLQFLSFTSVATQAVELSADQPWIKFGVQSFTTPFTVGVSLDSTLKEGVYKGNIIARTGGTSLTIPVDFQLYDIPYIVFSSAPLHFQYTIGGPLPSPQDIAITSPTLQPAYFQAGPTSIPSFLKVHPSSFNTPASVEVSADPTGLSPGTYTTFLEIDGLYPGLTSNTRIPVTFDVLGDPNAPIATLAGVADAASFLPGTVSPGEILVVAGTGLGPVGVLQSVLDSNGHFPTSLGGVTFLFDNVPAPVVYVSSAYAAVVAPFELSGKTQTSITVSAGGKTSKPLVAVVSSSNPSIFTANASGTGLAAALNFFPDGSSVGHSQTNPASPGQVVVFFATGLGLTTPVMANGSVVTQPIPVLTEKIRVLIGGQPVNVDYVGPAPGLIAGAMQLNVRIPSNAASGLQPVIVLAGDNPSQGGVTLAIR